MDQIGNAEADTAADLGRRYQSELIVDVRRCLLEVRTLRYPIMRQLHRFVIVISWVAVNHDGKGCSAPDPLVWDHGARKKVRWTVIRVNVDIASLPGPHGFLHKSWMQVHGGLILVLMLLPGRKVLAFSANCCPSNFALADGF